ncbi:MAG: FHA domain-containing protein [Armatimonadetes bacterium]|nr:FHA domain-containing protein [Armatimonadota bacterium]
MNPNVTQLLSADPNRTVMGTAPTLNATQTIKPVQCPVCKTFNPAGVMFCVECGLIFDRALPDDAFGAPVVRLPVLVDSNGKEFPIRPGANVVGREGDVMLADAKVSRRHAQITSNDGTFELEDLGSTNGTEWNGEKLAQGDKRTLSQGDKVSFGGIELTLSMPGAAGSTEMLSPNRTAMLSGPPSVGKGTEGQGDQGTEGPGDEGTAPSSADLGPRTSDPAPSPAAYLSIDGSDMPLKSGVNTFGRKPENDVQIVDPYVSGKHGVIDVREDGIYLTDSGSTNGTLMNGEKLEPNAEKLVTEEDEIRIGGLVLRIRAAA